MIILQQHVIGDDDPRTIDYYVTHIFAEGGYFKEKIGRKKRPSGWHIQLGTNDSPDNYTEVKDDTYEKHEIPDSMPDLVVHVITEEEQKAIERGENPWATEEHNG